MVFALILALAIAILAVFFALENTMIVTVSFFGYAVSGSLALFILAAVALGLLLGVLIMTPGRIKNSLSSRRNAKKINSLESSLDEHKSKLAAMEKPASPEPTPEVDELKPPELQ
jgi:uncharacterized integral membrane protein